MSQVSTGASELVRVTVTSDTRRVDLALPGTVPLAELLPDLARRVGGLDAGEVVGGCRLVTSGGRRLAGDSGLHVQGIEDGSLLTLAVGAEGPAPTVYDDVAEAMSDAVVRDLGAWSPAAARRTALAAAGLLLVGGAVALVAQRGSLVAAGAASLAAAVLLVGAIVLARAGHEPAVPVAMAWLASLHAAVAGLVAPSHERLAGLPVAGAGAGALLVGSVALLGLREGRVPATPPIGVGAVLVAAGLVMRATAFDPAVVLATALVLVVMSGSVFPWLALGATGTVGRHSAIAPVVAGAAEIDPVRVAADARLAHEILVSLSATVGVLLVLLAPAAVSLGPAGTVLAVLAAVVVMLRTRQYRAHAEVLVGLVSGIAGLASVAVSLLRLHADWWPATAAALSAAGGVVLLGTLLRSGQSGPSTRTVPSVRRGRLGDVAETVALVCLLPLLVVAGGLLAGIRG